VNESYFYGVSELFCVCGRSLVKKMFSLSPIANNTIRRRYLYLSRRRSISSHVDVPIMGFYIATSSEHGF